MTPLQTANPPRAHETLSEKLGVKSMDEIRQEAAAIEAEDPMVVERPRALAGAAAAWMSMTFLLCYVILPLTRQALGLRYPVAPTLGEEALMLGGELMAFLVTLGVTLGGIALARPRVHLGSTRHEPVLAATLGGLLPWAFLHNTLPFLVPFADMSAASLASFVVVNVLESAMFGAMLATFTRSPARAFVMGVGFQILFMTLGSILSQIALLIFYYSPLTF